MAIKLKANLLLGIQDPRAAGVDVDRDGPLGPRDHHLARMRRNGCHGERHVYLRSSGGVVSYLLGPVGI